MKDMFLEYHPFVNLIYFAVVLGITMFFMHPVYVCISLLCGLMYLTFMDGFSKTFKGNFYLIIMGLMVLIINPLFSHEGMTIITYFKNGNPLTLESIIYGGFMGILLMAGIVWFKCFGKIIDSDRFIYIFGKIMPRFSLILSMTMRFIPEFKNRFIEVRMAQKAIGKDFSEGNIFTRINNLARIISVVISWSMENSVETSDSMRARGYGYKRRTSFSVFKFEKKDFLVLLGGTILFACIIFSIKSGNIYYQYYPVFSKNLWEMKMIASYVIYFLLLTIPLTINMFGAAKWKYLESKI